jgi:hypothetical protein
MTVIEEAKGTLDDGKRIGDSFYIVLIYRIDATLMTKSLSWQLCLCDSTLW